MPADRRFKRSQLVRQRREDRLDLRSHRAPYAFVPRQTGGSSPPSRQSRTDRPSLLPSSGRLAPVCRRIRRVVRRGALRGLPHTPPARSPPLRRNTPAAPRKAAVEPPRSSAGVDFGRSTAPMPSSAFARAFLPPPWPPPRARRTCRRRSRAPWSRLPTWRPRHTHPPAPLPAVLRMACRRISSSTCAPLSEPRVQAVLDRRRLPPIASTAITAAAITCARVALICLDMRLASLLLHMFGLNAGHRQAEIRVGRVRLQHVHHLALRDNGNAVADRSAAPSIRKRPSRRSCPFSRLSRTSVSSTSFFAPMSMPRVGSRQTAASGSSPARGNADLLLVAAGERARMCCCAEKQRISSS